jgi:head-tail adaptor
MTAEEHFRKAEELAAKAGEYLGQGDGQDSATVWAAVAQVHATLAVAAGIEQTQARGTGPKQPD